MRHVATILSLPSRAGASPGTDTPSTDGDGAPLADARALAARLLAQLAPLLPTVAAATRSAAGADQWIDAWARQIAAAQLSPSELAGAVQRLGDAPPGQPLGWPQFLPLCRPSHLLGRDLAARVPVPPALTRTRDLARDPLWCSARDHALAKIRARRGA